MVSPIQRLLLIGGVVLGVAASTTAQDAPTDFAERFALAADRRAALDELVPGSDDYFYYSCLQRQHEGAFAAVPPLLEEWVRRHGRGARTLEIEHRQALLTFDADAAATYRYLQQQLEVKLDAHRPSIGPDLDVPTALDPERYSRRRFDERALARRSDAFRRFEQAGMRRLATTELSDSQLLSLLKHLERPDVPGLAALVARAMALPDGGAFGSLALHKQMTLAQLEELVRLRPQLLGDAALVEAWLRQLRPTDDAWRHDSAARLALLERLQAFADRLPPAHVSLQVHVRYHRLRHDLAAGTLDRERLLAYLRLPRPAGNVAEPHRRQYAGREAQLDASYPTGFAEVSDDERLVRDCLQHFLVADADWQPFAPYIERGYLEQLCAETQLLLGRGDAARWYAILGPQQVEALQRRVEFAFAPTQPRWFDASAPVSIEADVKNVQQLLVKVFAIDTYDYEREHGKAIDVDLDLDGLVANEERALTYDDAPLLRVRRRFEFPRLTAPGTYVIEFLGGGLRSRAVIQKGRLDHVVRIGAAGHALTVLDERGEVVRDATAWCAGREYTADADGEIVIPFAAERRTDERLVLRHGRLTAVTRFVHEDERYYLRTGFFMPREALVTGNRARLLVRPSLSLHGVPIPLALLENATLEITARDLDGNDSQQTVRDLQFADDAELVHEFTVPPRLRSLFVKLRGEVAVVTTGERAEVESVTDKFQVNEIDTSYDTRCPLLVRDAQGFYVEVRGRNGEPVAGVSLRLWLRSMEHEDELQELVRTDAAGRAQLGPLTGLRWITISPLGDDIHYWLWHIDPTGNSATRELSGLVGQTLRLPHATHAGDTPATISLLAVHESTFLRDASAHVTVRDGFVELKGLAAGDYSLWLPGDEHAIAVHVVAGAERAGWAVGSDRAIELPQRPALQIRAATVQGDTLQVRLGNATAGARVHVYATRYPETFDALARLETKSGRGLGSRSFAPPASTYVAAQQIDDEYRYVLDRRFRQKFPGNMLTRPGLLLNPWRLQPADVFDSMQWNSAVGLGGGAGGRYGSRASAIDGGRRGGSVGEWADLDFLAAPAQLLANLRPDRDGVVRVPLAQLGDGHLLHCIAVQGDDTAYRTATRTAPEMTPRDVRLASGLDPKAHFTEQRRVEFVAAGATTTIDDVATAEVVRYETLAHAFELLKTISGNGDLARFEWLTRWPTLGADERLQLYSQHACHEVHFFLWNKDRAFFDRIVRPYLQNKLDKTFLDRWLLEQDLTEFLQPWAFERLNVVEKILLTRRLPGLREAGARRVDELAALATPSAELAAGLFRQVLLGRALSAAAPDATKKANRDEKLAEGKNEDASLPPPPPPEAPAAQPAAEEVTAEELAEEEREVTKALLRDKDLARRQNTRLAYRPLGATQSFAESNYWHVPIAEHVAALVTANGFWRDYALAAADQAFGSAHLAEATHNVTEMLLALAVLDLPFAATPAVERRDGSRLELTADRAFLLARKELRQTGATDTDSRLLIGQTFRRVEPDRKAPATLVRDEFVAGVPYACQVVVSNPTATAIRLELLLQIPVGAVPLHGSAATRGVPMTLQPFSTATHEYAFYLPRVGDYAHFPAHAAGADGTLLAAAPATSLHVVTTPSKVDTTSWPAVARDGSEAEVLTFLAEHNLAQLDLTAIAWRVRDPAFFGRLLPLLRARLCYADALWAYGLLHQDRQAVHEWLAHREAFVAASGAALQSPLLTIDPVARHSYQHVEFAPLVHARAHPLGSEPQNRNIAVDEQYHALLDVLCHRAALDAADWMSVTCYLLLQDRVADGLAAFRKVDATALPTKLQYDYFRCYLEFFGERPEVARATAERYRDYPVTRWRQLFADVLTQLDEAAGNAAAAPTEVVATEPALDLAVAGSKATLRYQHLERCTVSCYPLDVEFAFSTAPFEALGGNASAYVVPDHEVELTLPAGQRELTIDLPERFRRRDVLVEATAAGITRRRTSLDNALAVQTIEGYGQLQVRHSTTGRPLPKVYVKVYARFDNGEVRFHKDGYTDLRGRFDYASVSNSDLDRVERFAVLVLSETDGAEIRELQPPR
ncbi:MAG: hypothetical protein H6835_10745 [Planctomycetes bacterium]|nr:hypothetical protein [Planctomycetota bacterium]